MSNIARAAKFANHLSELGCGFALDDFVRRVRLLRLPQAPPIRLLEIDGEFVRHCTTNETDRIPISAVVKIARGMGKQSIAEFVGDQDSVDVLTQLGVDYGQGYFLGRRHHSPNTSRASRTSPAPPIQTLHQRRVEPARPESDTRGNPMRTTDIDLIWTRRTTLRPHDA